MRFSKTKTLLLMLGLLFTTMVYGAYGRISNDGPNNIPIQISHTNGMPKDMYIQASIDGHCLTVVFTENLGQVVVEVTTDGGVEVDASALYTPNGVIFYIPETGSYIVTFTLPNGDVYYGEFEVTD